MRMKTHEHFAALVRLIAYKFAGSEEKAEKLVSWAYGIQGAKPKESAEDPTDTFIKEYLNPQKVASNIAVRRFADKHVGFPDEELNYGRICAVIRDMDYNKEFLLTTYWKGIALVVKERAGNKCALCGADRNLVAHHTTYEHYGDELHHLEDLQCLCRDCHNKAHNITPEPVAETKPVTAPQRHKPRTGSALSITAILAENEDPFTVPFEEEVLRAWEKMPERYANRPRLQNILRNAHTETTFEDGKRKLTFTVMNKAQLAWVQGKLLPELTDTIKEIVGNDLVSLAVREESEE